MTKRLVSAILLILIFTAFGVYADETEAPEDTANIARVVVDVSEPDENDIITAKFTVYNTTYKGILAYFSYNKEAVTPIDYETKEPTTEFERFAKRTTVAKDLETGEDIENWCSDAGSKLENSRFSFFNVVNITKETKFPNSIVTENKQILADDKGLLLKEFYFKKISNESIGLKLLPNEIYSTGFSLISSKGVQSYFVSINFPEGLGEDEVIYYSPEMKVKASKQEYDSKEEYQNILNSRSVDVVFFQIGNYATVSNKVLKWIDKDNKKIVPFIKDGFTMVPLRYLAEELGANVTFVDDTQDIIIKTEKTILMLTIGNKEYFDDGLKKKFDIIPEVIDGRTFVPLRFVAEALDRSVTWIESERMVITTRKNYPWNEDNSIEKSILSNALLLMTIYRDFAY